MDIPFDGQIDGRSSTCPEASLPHLLLLVVDLVLSRLCWLACMHTCMILIVFIWSVGIGGENFGALPVSFFICIGAQSWSYPEHSRLIAKIHHFPTQNGRNTRLAFLTPWPRNWSSETNKTAERDLYSPTGFPISQGMPSSFSPHPQLGRSCISFGLILDVFGGCLLPAWITWPHYKTSSLSNASRSVPSTDGIPSQPS